MLHFVLKIIISISIRIYYRKIKIRDGSFLDSSGPLIIVANHPNTLMDAWMIGYACKQPVYFMAKATLFDSKFKMWLLKALKMIPINRAGEGSIGGVSNSVSFEKCYEVLENGKTLVIFPEGSSFLERNLRELKLGAARIAIEVGRRGKAEVKVVPVGINYMRAEKFRSRVYLHVGKPIQANLYLPKEKESVGPAAKKLTEQIRISLERLLVNMENKEEEVLIDKIAKLLSSKYEKKARASSELVSLLKIRDRLDEIKLQNAYKMNEIEEVVAQLSISMSRLKIKPDFLDRRYRGRMFVRQLIFSILFIFLALPIFLFGMIHNYIPYRLTDLLIPKISKEVEYCAPLAVLIGILLYPIWYVSWAYLLSRFIHPDWPIIVYFIAMPISGIFSYFFIDYLKHIGYKWSYLFAVRNKENQVIELKRKRENLRSYFE